MGRSFVKNGKWSRKNDACTKCNRSDVEHHAKEMCHYCYNQNFSKDRRKYFHNRWREMTKARKRVFVDMRPHHSFSGVMTSKVYSIDGEKVVNVRGSTGVHKAIPISRVYPQGVV